MSKLVFQAADAVADIAEDPRSWLPSPSALVEECEAFCRQGEQPQLEAMFESMGTPPLDLLVTPLSARVGGLAYAQGQAFFHHELRGRLPFPESLGPERPVWEGGQLPEWRQGILTEPKYFSFFLDAPFAPYNPNYRRKWRAHELLHGLCGFFWHPQMSRFACYLGARLDELLPVVHWYGLDEVLRPRCPEHQGRTMARELCATCEAMARPFWSSEPSWIAAQRELAEDWVGEAWEHFDEEWQACLRELESGVRVQIRRGHLDASGDAMGYLMSHWNRLTAWSFGQWVELFCRDGRDYYSDLSDFMARIATVLQNISSGEIAISPREVSSRRLRRAIQDVAYRTLCTLEWFDDGSPHSQAAEDALMPLLEAGASMLDAPDEAEALPLLDAIAQTQSQVLARYLGLPKALKVHFPRLGYLWREQDEQVTDWLFRRVEDSIAMVSEGLHTAAPESWDRTGHLPDGYTIIDFLRSPQFLGGGRLLSRFQRWVEAQEQTSMTPELLQWLAFEAWLHEEPRRDPEAEQFATLPGDLSQLALRPGRLRLHRTFRQRQFPPLFASKVMHEELPDAPCELAAVVHLGEIHLLKIEPEMQEVLDALQRSPQVESWLGQVQAAAVELLLEHAVLVWLPAPSTL